MKRKKDSGDSAGLDELIEEITVDAYGDDEQLWAFRQVCEDNLALPADAFVIGESISVLEIDYDGNERRGLTATCRRVDGSEHVVSAAELSFPAGSVAARYVAAYRKWLGIEPYLAVLSGASRRPQHKVTAADIDLDAPVEVVALSLSDRAARCRLLGTDRIITLRATRLWEIAPGMIVTVKPRKRWEYAGHPYLSGEIAAARIDAAALDLKALELEEMGTWNPETEPWEGAEEPLEEWAKPIAARGSHSCYRMEQILPGVDWDDPDSDPIIQANDLREAGDLRGAERVLMSLCESDLRCLDAHAHLGNMAFERVTKDAILHFEVGVRIGELSLGADFDGLLPWRYIHNRPFLRCLHGYGMCLWRLGHFDEAALIFERLLWLNPTDDQNIRFSIDDVRSRKAWEDDVEKKED